MLEGIVRESIGKRNAKQLKRDGYLIANIYAHGVENINAAFKRGEFVRTIRNKDVFIQEYQLHPVNGDVTHVDLRVAVPGQVTNFLVPVTTHGTPVGLKNKGVLVISKKRLKLRGIIEDMPVSFDLDVEPLDRGQSILVRDVEVPANCKMMDRDNVAICGVIQAK
jgi:large subunit ribosomal protein L25